MVGVVKSLHFQRERQVSEVALLRHSPRAGYLSSCSPTEERPSEPCLRNGPAMECFSNVKTEKRSKQGEEMSCRQLEEGQKKNEI